MRNGLAGLVAGIVLLGGTVSQCPAACAIESTAERICGFEACSSAVEQAVPMIQRGEYSLALLRLNTEAPKSSVPQQARIIGAYALLVAGEKLGAFPAGL